MNRSDLINKTINFVKSTLEGAEGGHDWFHIDRVWKNAKLIAQTENADLFIIELGALLHDIADAKFHNGNEKIGPKKARDFLKSENVSNEVIQHIENIIQNISFKNSLDPEAKKFHSIELDIIQDADRLDAIGAIGIARAFNYGGFKNREIYNPDIKPDLHLSKEEYKNSNAPTINHFYEKLLLLKDKMNTKSGLLIGIQRHDFMVAYLKQFFKESDAKIK